MLRNSLVVIPFNAQLKDGCDYALQTIRILAKHNQVVAVLLGEPYTWPELIKDLVFRLTTHFIQRDQQGTLWFKPMMWIPGQRWLPIKKFNVYLSTLMLKMILKSHEWGRAKSISQVLWFFEPFFMPIFLDVLRDFESVYDCVDRYHPLGKEAQRAEALVKQKVDHMTVISEPLLTEHQPQRPDAIKVPLGFDELTFARLTPKRTTNQVSLKNKKSLLVGFCGGINYRLDFPLLFELINRHPQHHFWFVGPQQLTLIPGDTQTAHQVEKLLALPNVKWTPPLPKSKIPALIDQMDVCLIPYDLQYEFNRFCHPMKVAEYLYIGKPVITTPIIELTQPLYQNLVLVGATAAEFSRHLKTIQKNGWSADRRRHQRAVAASQSWEKKVVEVSQVLTTAA